jgi:hypothetical protein
MPRVVRAPAVPVRAARGRTVTLRVMQIPGADPQARRGGLRDGPVTAGGPGAVVLNARARGPRGRTVALASGEPVAVRPEMSVPAPREDRVALTEAGRAGPGPAVVQVPPGRPGTPTATRRTPGSPHAGGPAPRGATVVLTEAGDGKAVAQTAAGKAMSGTLRASGPGGQGPGAMLMRAGKATAGRRAGGPVRRDGPVIPARAGVAVQSPQAGAPGPHGGTTTRTAAAAGPGTPAGVQMGRGRDAALMAASLVGNVLVGHGRTVTVRRGAGPGKAGLCRPGRAAAAIQVRRATRRDRRSPTT